MRTLAGCLLIVAACGGDDGYGPPGADASPHGNDATSATSLRLLWVSSPPIPGPLMNDIDVATATFRLSRLQIVGDGGSSDATTLEDFELAWTSGTPMPQSLIFDTAPLGLYSKVAFDIEGDVSHSAFELTGMAKVGADMEPFRIFDTQALDVSIDGYDVELKPGDTASLTVKLDLKPTLQSLNFNQFPVVGGVRTLGPNDPQIVGVRDTLEDAFAGL